METERMNKSKKRNQKRILNTIALGLSLSMTSVLLYNNVLSVHASPVVSADEETAINTFLNTQPVNGDSITIATTNPSPVALHIHFLVLIIFRMHFYIMIRQ